MALNPTEKARLPLASAASTFLFFAAIMGTRPIIPLLAVELEFSGAEIGVLVAMFSVLPLFGATAVGTWMDRHGAKGVLLFGALATAIGLMCPMLLPSRPGLYISQIIAGCGFTMYTIAAQKHAGSLGRSSEDRQRNIASFSFLVALGSFAGPILVGLIAEHIGFIRALFLSTVSIFACLVFLLGFEDTQYQPGGERGRLLSNPLSALSYHNFMFRAFLISAFVLLARDTYIAYFPLHAQNNGVSTSWIGIIIGLHNGGSVLARALLMTFVRHLGRNITVILSIIFAGLCFLAIPLCHSIPAFIIVSVALGIGLGVGQPLSIITAIGLAPVEKVGQVLGARLTCNRMMQILAPLIFGGMAAQIGLSGAFWAVGTFMVLGSPRLTISDNVTSEDARSR